MNHKKQALSLVKSFGRAVKLSELMAYIKSNKPETSAIVTRNSLMKLQEEGRIEADGSLHSLNTSVWPTFKELAREVQDE